MRIHWRWVLGLALVWVVNALVFAARAEAQDCFWAPNNDGDPPRYWTVADRVTDLEADFLSDPMYSDFIWTNSPAPSCREYRDEGGFGWQIQFDLIWSDETHDPGRVRHRTATIWAHDCDPGSPYFDGESCGQPPDCAATEGDTVQRWIAETMDPSGVINEGGCEYTASGVGACVQGTCFAEYTGTGEPFEPPETAPENEPVDDPPCLEGQSGRTVCQDVQEQHCGYYMGERYCVTPQDQPGCKQTQSGAIICHGDGMGGWSADQPQTDFGGDKPPADEWEHHDQSGGGHDLGGWPYGGGGSENPETGDGGTGGDTGFPGDGDGEGEEPCDPNIEDCDGTGEVPGQCEGDDCDVDGAFSRFLNRIQSEGIGGAIAQADMPTGGECPTASWETELLGSQTLDAHCTLAEENRTLVSVIFLAIWAVTAVTIFLRA